MVVSARRTFGPPSAAFCRAGLRPASRLCGGAPPSTPPGVTAGPLRAPDPQGDSFYGERVTRKPAKGASPLAIPLGYPTPPREKVSLRSPLSDGGKASSSMRVPIQEATTEKRSLSWVLIDRSPGYQQSGSPQDITTGSLACGYHQYSSEYNAGTCPTKGRQGKPFRPNYHCQNCRFLVHWTQGTLSQR